MVKPKWWLKFSLLSHPTIYTNNVDFFLGNFAHFGVISKFSKAHYDLSGGQIIT